ncbi:MAG: cytidine deaminase [Flavobacteriaceae bacterium]|nr:cytidine deaminase [Flavobacteriaceae bacterium]
MKKINVTTSFTVYNDLSELSKGDIILFKKAINIRDTAYAPYSNFLVGTVVLLANGKVITGSNQENAAYPSGLCAERVALYYAASKYPNIDILKIVISAKSNNQKVNQPVAPCGSCRQVIAEYEIKQTKDITLLFMGETGKIIESPSLKNLLPLGFDKTFL